MDAPVAGLDGAERRALVRRVIGSKRAVVVRGALAELGIAALPPGEQRVLRALAGDGPVKKAAEIAAEAGLTLAELERTCDALLEKGLIGPRSPDFRFGPRRPS